MATKTEAQRDAKHVADAVAQAALREWCEAAIAAGEVYANTIVGRTGMSALVQLAVVKDGRLVKLWPCYGGDNEFGAGGAQERQRKALSFSYDRRGIVVGGCGFNREVHALETVFRVAGLNLDQRAVRVSSAF